MGGKRPVVTTAALAFGFLMLGVLCYVFFNHETYLSHVLPQFGIPFPRSSSGSLFHRIAIGYAADLLWAAAMPLAIQTVLQLKGKKQVWLALSVVVGCGYELSQKAGWIAGTFDWIDLIVYSVGTVLSLWIIHKIWR
ncbi:MAG: hypothetical protein IKG85_01070 [Clostridia bacterium]|nr:hypothetical protein [Clostridia bacterium]